MPTMSDTIASMITKGSSSSSNSFDRICFVFFTLIPVLHK